MVSNSFNGDTVVELVTQRYSEIFSAVRLHFQVFNLCRCSLLELCCLVFVQVTITRSKSM